VISEEIIRGGALCPACGCDEVRWAHPLGSVLWAECRDCGIEYRTELCAEEEAL